MNFKLPTADPHGLNDELMIAVSGAEPEEAHLVEVVRRHDNQTIGTKRFYNRADFEVGLLGFVLQSIEIEPVRSLLPIGVDQKRAFGVYVKVGEAVSNSVMVCGSKQNMPYHQSLSAICGMTQMCRRDRTELSLLTNLESRIAVSITLKSKSSAVVDYSLVSTNGSEGAEGVLVVSLFGEYWAEQLALDGSDITLYDYAEVEVRDSTADKLIARHRVEFCEPSTNSLRLCWVNTTGGVDYHTFPFIKRRVSNIDKSRVRTSSGGRITSAIVDRQIVVNSEFLLPEMFEQVAAVVSSPKVWMCQSNGEYLPVDLLDSQVAYENSCKQRLEITVRQSIEEEYIV